MPHKPLKPPPPLALACQVCNLVEYLYLPEGFTIFEEGDRVDFCYVILQVGVGGSRLGCGQHTAGGGAG